jgi:membrane protease YdiL (CAAX protease family)
MQPDILLKDEPIAALDALPQVLAIGFSSVFALTMTAILNPLPAIGLLTIIMIALLVENVMFRGIELRTMCRRGMQT